MNSYDPFPPDEKITVSTVMFDFDDVDHFSTRGF